MSPEKARVFVAEDDSDWQDMLGEILKDAGHSVVARATNLHDALNTAKRLSSLKVDVAVIDGNLSEDESRGYDGQAVLNAIRQHAPRVRTIGMSGSHVAGTDVDLGKAKATELGEVVRKL